MALRILHVNKYLYRRGGAEGYMYDVAARQTQRGAQVAFWGMAHPDAPPQRYESQLMPHLELEPAPAGVLPRVGAAARTLWSETARRRLSTVLEDFRPDVAHLHNIYHHLSPSVLQALKAHHVPIVMTLHDYKLACPSYHLLAGDELCTRCLDGRFRHAVQTRCKGSLGASALVALEARLHRSLGLYDPVDVFLSPSRFLADMMSAAGVYPDRIRVLGFPADVASMVARTEPGGPVTFVGRLAREKGADTLVEAVGLLTGTRLVVVGDGPERGRLEALADAVAPGRVTFHGQLDRATTLAMLRAAAVVAVPSRWYENMPMVVLEALGSAVPVVASNLGGLPELVRHGVDGRLVRHGDPAALADALAMVLEDPLRASEMGRAGRARVLSDFAPDGHVDRLFEVYHQAASTAGPSSLSRGATG